MAFMDIREYSKPQTREELISRVRANVAYFRLIYGATYLFVLLYSILTSPFILGEVVLVLGLWVYLFQIRPADEPVNLGGTVLGRKEKLLLMIPLTTFVAVLGGLISYLIWIMVLGSLIVGTHASFRNKIEANPLDELADMSNV